MFAQQMQFMLPGAQLQPITTFPVTPSLATSPTMAFSPYLSHVSPGMGLVPAELLPNTPVLVSGNPTVTVPGGSAGQKLMRTDKLEVCREFQRGNCTRGENDCRYAHPIDIAMIDTNENTVTVCMDYIKGRCSREKCKYFHPPAHLQAKIKAAQHQVNQTAAAAMALPPGALQPLPKRPALEKNNGATTVFNPSVFHYQQALANMQLQQPTFIPTDDALRCLEYISEMAAHANKGSLYDTVSITEGNIKEIGKTEEVKKEGAQEQVPEEMALADANKQCKAAILSLPMELAPTLDDMLQKSPDVIVKDPATRETKVLMIWCPRTLTAGYLLQEYDCKYFLATLDRRPLPSSIMTATDYHCRVQLQTQTNLIADYSQQ
ncbi:hypothetical protein DUI87_03456 [Hirundo rustica rustica]|uniref:C3H1-type domain-containing protein n=1 Tax=Hirundo rustica rustica TaxID=333673 RepID=A0A3M0LA60_HIRRU|nr:hypothetical protein DUI87_03456 [Hirundo rustica rustica]